jgi:hypothetical protein
MALYSGQFKGEYRNCGKIALKLFQCKNGGNQNDGNNGGNTSGIILMQLLLQAGTCETNCLKLKKKDSLLNNTNNNPSGNGNYSNCDREMLSHTTFSLQQHQMLR